MNTHTARVFDKYSFDNDAMNILAFAGAMAKSMEDDAIFCSHVFAACVFMRNEIVHLLLGHSITKLPRKFNVDLEEMNNAATRGLKMDFSEEFAMIFLEESTGTPFQMIREYAPDKKIGITEILYAMLMEPTNEIADILIENGVSNNILQLEERLRENYLINIRNIVAGSPRENLAKALDMGQRFKDCMTASLVGQRKAIEETAEVLTDFWFKGNNSKPLSILLLSKSKGGRSYFARMIQRAFVELGMQNKVDPALELCGFVHDQSCEVDLLGDAKSYRNARCGKLYTMAKNNCRGAMVFEDILDGSRSAQNIIRSFCNNSAYDKYHEETIMIPFNVLVFTMRLTDDQYRFLKEEGEKGIDARLLNKVFLESDNKSWQEENAATNSSSLWQCMDRIVLLEQLSDDELTEIAEAQFAKIENHLDQDYGIAFRCNGRDRLIQMFLQSSPNEIGPGEIISNIDSSFRELWQNLNNKNDIEHVTIDCEPLPEYRNDPARRIIRGDYLDFSKDVQIKENDLQLTFRDIQYRQQDRIDCKNYRIERPKGITFDDIVGLDDVRDELLDTLSYITGGDELIGKVPAPCQSYLLVGPPGCGKTSLACALSATADIPVFFATSAVFTDAQQLNKMFRKAQELAPAIVILDEFNSIGNSQTVWKRDAVNELLATLDGVQKYGKILLIACTNHPEQVEEALLRPGRFRQVKIGLPNRKARTAFTRKFEKKYNIDLGDETREAFIDAAEGFSPAEMNGILGFALRTSIMNKKTLDWEMLTEAIIRFNKDKNHNRIGFNRGDER